MKARQAAAVSRSKSGRTGADVPLPLSPAAPLRSTTPASSRRHAGSALRGGVGAGRSGRGSGLAVDGNLDEHRGVGVRLDQHKRHLLSAGGGQGGEPPTKARSERAHACWGRGVLCVCQHQLRTRPARTAVDPATNNSSARQRFASATSLNRVRDRRPAKDSYTAATRRQCMTCTHRRHAHTRAARNRTGTRTATPRARKPAASGPTACAPSCDKHLGGTHTPTSTQSEPRVVAAEERPARLLIACV